MYDDFNTIKQLCATHKTVSANFDGWNIGLLYLERTFPPIYIAVQVQK
ncbi:hypothetical protein SB48_HM08orf01938 [Heyndrickxia coagulans]|uniref:Uncharacterized protein n=1 Tax=Heyndrickxia coagulans TaxID=1398 RepID=A0AAN0T4U1_HEYCO|nr:hypothetical protein SB48_HM08orf01938 [Heyndrickxia coagulans]